jgi:uncharacterized protein (TIGR02246 family)
VSDPTVEQRLRAIEDRTAIADLAYEYARLVDANEPEQVAALFTEDACVDYGAGLGGPQHGREAVVRLLGALRAFERTHHHIANHQIRFDGPDHATGIAYVIAWHLLPEARAKGRARTAVAYGRYEDEYVRTDAGWRFAARRIALHGHEDFPAEWNWVARRSA